MKIVGQLKDSVSGILQGATLANITNLNGALERAARVLAQNADIPEATGTQRVTCYDGVYDYLAPTTIFGGALIDFAPLGITRTPLDYVYKKPVEYFDRTKHLLPNGVMVSFKSDNGVNIMRVAETRATQKVLIDDMSQTTGWVASGTASTPIVDSTYFYQSPASLRFNATGSGTATLTKTLTNPLSISSYEDVGVVFLAFELPTSTNLTSIELRLGSSATNYNSVTATHGFLGAWQSDTFFLVAFDLSQSSQVGTPNFSAINYVQINIAHTATITNTRVGYLFISLPTPYEILFQSAAIFSHNGTLSNTITDDNDTIILNDAAYTIYEHEAAFTVALQSTGRLGAGVMDGISQVLHGIKGPGGAIVQMGLYDQYRADNPSEELRMVGNYYNDSN